MDSTEREIMEKKKQKAEKEFNKKEIKEDREKRDENFEIPKTK